MCRTARQGSGAPDAGRVSVCRKARQGRGGPDAGRLSVCVGQQDRGWEHLMQEDYMCVCRMARQGGEDLMQEGYLCV